MASFARLFFALAVLLTAAVAAFATADGPTGSGMVNRIYGLYKSSPSTLSDGEYDVVRLTTLGQLRTSIAQDSASWSVVHTPSANAQATASKAAAGAGIKHVCKGYAWSLSSGAGAPTPELITIAIRDGATGAGTILWQETVSLPATAGSNAGRVVTGLYLVGTANTAMTIETDSAPGANVVASVSFFGEDIR